MILALNLEMQIQNPAKKKSNIYCKLEDRKKAFIAYRYLQNEKMMAILNSKIYIS